MEQPLRQITNQIQRPKTLQSILNFSIKPQANILQKKQKQTKEFSFKQLISVSHKQINYGQCVPSSIYQQSFTLTMNKDLQRPMIFTIQIVCEDQKLNDLSEFVFAIKKGNLNEFTDVYKFRLYKKGKYDFTIAVKTPKFINYKAQSKLKISSELSNLNDEQQSYSIYLKQLIFLPTIQCPRQLQTINNSNSISCFNKDNKNIRVIKIIQLRSKPKRQVKIPFRLEENTRLTLISDLLSVNQNQFQKDLIEIKPKQISLAGKGQFLITFKLNFLQHLVNYLEKAEKNNKNQQIVSYTVRRILVMRINQTDFNYHFPIQVNFLLGDKKERKAYSQ